MSKTTAASIFMAGKQNVVPFITGSTLGELTGPGRIVMPRWIQDYLNLLKGASKAEGRAFAYVFDHVPAGWKKDGVVSCHGMDMPYVVGDLERRGDTWQLVFSLAQPSGAKSADPGLSDVDRGVSELMMTMWTNFAKTGNPNVEGLIDWPAWDEAKDQFLYITESPEVRSGFSKVAQK